MNSIPIKQINIQIIPNYQFGNLHLVVYLPSNANYQKIGKVANQANLAVLSHSEPLWWEKIGKVVNQVNLAIPSHYEPL